MNQAEKITIPIGTTYVGLPVSCGTIGGSVFWSSTSLIATFTVDVTTANQQEAPVNDTSARWVGSGVSFPAAASAAGGFAINLENVRQARARLKIVATAAGEIEVSKWTR